MKRLGLAVGLLIVALAGAVAWRQTASDDRPPLIVTHWSNSHPMRDGLLPQMATEFNDADHETASGQPIEIDVVSCDSSVQVADLVSRVKGTGPAQQGCETDAGRAAADPTIVTPQSGDWLVDVNHRAGHTVIDLEATEHIAETWLGIVTYRAMAECLGWPDRDLGYADILALRADPDGWEAHPDCARAEWGRRPLLAFTNPNTSTSGRNVLVSLYSIAAGKPPADLTEADIERPEVVQYVKDFQQLVDHYMPGTIPLNTKIVQGPRYGHFFLMPEDNLVSLQQGNEKAIATDGTEQPVPAMTDLVMIYPKEGSVLNSNPAGLVGAGWVSDDAADAAREWIDFLRDEEPQRRFMDAGFRPATGTGFTADARRLAAWGLDAQQPGTSIEPGDLQPAVLERIIESWGAVKNPAIVTFVVDTSGSMDGQPLAHVKDGLTRVLDAIAGTANQQTDNQVGLVAFSDVVTSSVAPAPLRQSRYDIADAIFAMEANGSTALYDAVQRAVELTDRAEGDPRATRAVVVLSDGEATDGRCLDTIVAMRSRAEQPVTDFCAVNGNQAFDADGRHVPVEDINGESLLIPHDHPIQVFFLGFGDADIHIGRILAQATSAEYHGSTQNDLAAVIEDLSGYF